MFSYADASPSLPNKHRRGGPVHVEVILRDLEASLADARFGTGEHGPEHEPVATATAPQTPYPQAACG